MRGLRSTLFFLAVLVGLGAYIYFVEWKRDPNAATAKEKAFASVSTDDVEEVRIVAGGETSRVQKADGTWKLVEPAAVPADQGELSSIASSLSSLEIQSVVDENAADLKQYGLEPARVEVGFRTKGQKDLRSVLIGDKTPTGGDLYARLPGTKKVFLISSYLDNTFNKTTFALRDKRILPVEKDKVDGLEAVAGPTRLQFAKSGSEWTIVKPIAARADFGVVESAVDRLAAAQMQGIVDELGENPARFGLNQPTATMTLSLGSARATLTLGKTENALVYAKDSSRPMIFTVAPTLQSDIVKNVSEYRRKDLFDSRSFTANRLEIRRGSETVVIEKTKGKDDKEAWRTADGKDVDSGKAEDLLAKVTGLRALSFEAAAHASLKTPALTVNVRYDTDKTEAVTFGRAGSDVFASRTGEPGSAKLDAMPFDEVTKALDAIKTGGGSAP
jgi:hypothetical protein